MVSHMIDVGSYAISLSLIGGYHLYLRARLSRDRSYTIQSVNNKARSAWVENMMASKSNGVLAVQTLRNSTMAATFLASTAILLAMGVVNLMQNTSNDNVLHTIQTSFLQGGNLLEIKLLILLVTFFLAFFCFSMALRMYNHVGYLINSSNDKFHPTPCYVSNLLNRSGSYYSLGMRAYYLSIPLIFALFNPYYMAASSVALIAVLYHIDRAPDLHGEEGESAQVEQTNKLETGNVATASKGIN